MGTANLHYCDDPSDYRSQAQSSTAHVPITTASAEPLLTRLTGVVTCANGWRARCPACGGTSRKLSIAVSDNRVLIYCFACTDTKAVLDAVGLRWADLQPPTHRPQTREEKRRAHALLREVALAGAVELLAMEWKIVHLAAQAQKWAPLSDEDTERLRVAGERIDRLSTIIC